MANCPSSDPVEPDGPFPRGRQVQSLTKLAPMASRLDGFQSHRKRQHTQYEANTSQARMPSSQRVNGPAPQLTHTHSRLSNASLQNFWGVSACDAKRPPPRSDKFAMGVDSCQHIILHLCWDCECDSTTHASWTRQDPTDLQVSGYRVRGSALPAGEHSHFSEWSEIF